MTDTPPDPPVVTSGKSRAITALLASFIATYCMNWLSLHGVNFEVDVQEMGLKVSSEVVKSSLIAQLVAFFTWLTWKNVVISIRDTILSLRDAMSEWSQAWRGKS